MANDFLHYYLKDADRVYKYRLKFACDELDDNTMDQLETGLNKYELQNCSTPKVTPIQEHPIDFPNIKNTRVCIVDCELRYPASHDLLRNIAAESTGVNIGAIAVYGEFDPRDQATEDALRMQEQSEGEDAGEALLGTDYEDDGGADEYYGKTLTDRLLADLAKYRSEREDTTVTNSLIPDQVRDDFGVGVDDVGEAGGRSVIGGSS